MMNGRIGPENLTLLISARYHDQSIVNSVKKKSWILQIQSISWHSKGNNGYQTDTSLSFLVSVDIENI